MPKGENHLTKRQYAHATTNPSITATFTTTNTALNPASTTTTCKGNTLILLLIVILPLLHLIQKLTI